MRNKNKIQFITKSVLLCLAVLIIILISNVMTTYAKDCTPEDAMKAEDSAYGLKGWKEIYDSFIQFSHCDDGAIAEGFSDSIVTMLAYRWDEVLTLKKLAGADSKFLTFTIRHIDATTSIDDLRQVVDNAISYCPAESTTLCDEIKREANRALKELADLGIR
ncbi:MAG: hypothetical protein Q7U10_12125 [Thermodesulfovibrionia bacterium]|nr:hypothetical protein [Thermodesulfovibrionia bacterium]